MITPRDAVRDAAVVEHGGRLALVNDSAHRHQTLIDFSVCLNAHGPAPSVVQAIRSAPIDEYPDPRSTHARSAFAEHWRVDAESVMVAAGSAELIQAVCFAYVRSDDTVLIVTPAFGEYARAAALCGATIATVALNDGPDTLSDARLAVRTHRPRLVFIASPVNPTGASLSRETLASLADACAEVDALLVLDQAYDTFADQPLGTPALGDHANVVQLRSLTKEHALAGIRVAAGVGPTHVVDAIERVRVPWATSSAAQAAALASLEADARTHARETVAQLRAECRRIAAAITAFGGDVYPTTTHYMLVACDNATALRDRLVATHGILVRDCTSFGLARHVRIAARRQHDNDHLIDALRDTLS